MNVLVINAGSSSLKYQLIEMENEMVLASGACERIGLEGSQLDTKLPNGVKRETLIPMKNHADAMVAVQQALTQGETKVIESMDEVHAVGHRVVQGGPKLLDSVIINEAVVAEIDKNADFAPLHNPAGIQGIRACQQSMSVPQVAVFDTAFHSTMPPEAYIFPLPYEYYEKYQLRRYGFHGTSHKFVSRSCAKAMGIPLHKLKIITCHLGNGCSITAIKHGKSVDTSMGLTPLDGFLMGTRCGGVDPSAILYLMKKEGWDLDAASNVMNKKSGALGISGVSSDDRDLRAAAADPAHPMRERALLARKIQHYQVRKYIGAYAAAMDGVDAIVFTGGIGENTADIRANICENLTYLGVKFDAAANENCVHGVGGEVSAPGSKVRVFVLPTNEELLIARETRALVEE